MNESVVFYLLFYVPPIVCRGFGVGHSFGMHYVMLFLVLQLS